MHCSNVIFPPLTVEAWFQKHSRKCKTQFALSGKETNLVNTDFFSVQIQILASVLHVHFYRLLFMCLCSKNTLDK